MLNLINKSLELRGNSKDVVVILKDILQLFEKIDGVNVDLLLLDVSKSINELEDVNKDVTVSIDDSPSVEVLKYLSGLNTKVNIKLQSENTDCYNETIIKAGKIESDTDYKTAFSLKLNNHELMLNNETVKSYLLDELYYLVEESGDDEEYKSLVLDELSDIKFDGNYNKVDLINIIDEVYKEIA